MFFDSYEAALRDAAVSLGMPRDWLFNVINLESNWSADAYNGSGAVGLIQFMPATLKGMGLLSPSVSGLIPSDGPVPEGVKQLVKTEFLAKWPDAIAQLNGPVRQYFKPMRPFPTEQSVYMAVFYPKFRTASLDTVFPANVQAQNPGIDTVGDYVALVQKKALTASVLKKGIPLLGVALLGFAAYFISRA
jgi:hypothetical protein